MLRNAVGVIAAATLVLAVGGSVSADATGDHSHTSVSASAVRPPHVVVYAPPLPTPLRVLRGFTPPQTAYGPGHLGVDLDPRSTLAVVAAANGKVSFAGPVGGRGVVVLVHPDGVRTEYEPLQPLVRAGDLVRRGQVIGDVSGTHRGCAVTCLHWGARRGDTYLDPLSLLGGLGPVRLLPWP